MDLHLLKLSSALPLKFNRDTFSSLNDIIQDQFYRQKSEERSYYGQRAYDIFEKYHIGPITFVISIFIVGYGWKQYYINDMRAEFLPDSLKGKTILVTGASSGYGKLISEEIAIRGGKVIMASRSMNNLRIAKKEILNEHPDADIEITHLDLG